MTEETALRGRQGDVLKEIVDVYTQTGQPVGSKTVSERLPAKLSPASVRNVMAELEEKGYLQSPHTSAGRIPTENGLRYYANGLVQVSRIDKKLERELAKRLEDGTNLDEVMNEASQILGQVTGCAGLIWAPQQEEDTLDQVEFVRLSGERVLVILVTESGQIENRMILVPDSVSAQDLKVAAYELNKVIKGLTLPEARQRIVKALQEQKMALDEMMDDFMDDGGKADDINSLIVGGSQNLFSYPELVRDQLQQLFQVFEEKKLLIGLIDQMRRGDGVQVFIGADCPLDVAKDCAMITADYGSEDKRTLGTIGVIGPMRMNYAQNIALVDYTARMLSQTVNNLLKGSK